MRHACFCLQISRSGIKVKVDSGGTNGDRAQVGRVIVVAGVSGLRAGSGSSSDGLTDVSIDSHT